MKHLIILITLFSLLSFKGKYTVKDTNDKETIFKFDTYSGWYYDYETFYYFDYWIKRDIMTIVYKKHGVYEGTRYYRIVGDKLIEINTSYTLILRKHD